MSEGRVIQLNPHSNMSPEECLSFTSRNHDMYEDVIVFGYGKNGEFIITSSNVSREAALWIAMELVDYVRKTGRHLE